MSNALCDHIPFLNVNHYTIIPSFIFLLNIASLTAIVQISAWSFN